MILIMNEAYPSEGDVKEVFSKMSFFRESDFIYYQLNGKELSISFTSNHLSTRDGSEVSSKYDLLDHRGQEKGEGMTGYGIKINLETRERTYGILHVRNQHRGKGVGRELVTAMEEVCRQFHVALIRTHSHRNSGFWRKMGYVRCGKEYQKRL